MYTFRFQQTDPNDWFCGPEPHIGLIYGNWATFPVTSKAKVSQFTEPEFALNTKVAYINTNY